MTAFRCSAITRDLHDIDLKEDNHAGFVRTWTLQKAELRAAWPNESKDFTPWLADNISELGEVLGLDLELQSREARVGAFSLDLLALDSGTNRTVIIENQLQPTDHDHLGKLLTYACGYDAQVIIWVAKEFRDEHRQAIDWLNQRTGQETEFYGVVVEVWTIDGSRPAPYFNLVSTPNEWQREATEAKRLGNTSDRNLRYKAFFQILIDRLRELEFTNVIKAQPQSWYLFSGGYGQRVQFGACFGQGETVRVEVYINSNDKDWNKTLFDQLFDRKERIETELGDDLFWERLDHRQASRVSLSRRGSIDDDEKTRGEITDWLISNLLEFKRVFAPHLGEFVG